MKTVMKRILISICIIFFFSSLTSEVFGGPRGRGQKKRGHRGPHRFQPAPIVKRPAPPVSGYIWIPRLMNPAGVFIGGFWRPPYKEGFLWIEGYLDESGVWVFGYWRPRKVKAGYLWVPGYWNSTIWIKGFWRPGKKPGHIWIPGYFNIKGVWVKGYWGMP